MIKLVSHVGICVDDLDESSRFYVEALGFVERSRSTLSDDVGPIMELDDLRGANCFLERDGVTIELLHFDAPAVEGAAERRPMNRHGFTHMACHVHDIDEASRAIEALGGQSLPHTRHQIVRDGFNGPIEIMYATDPNGVRLELIRFPT